jgi:hypothetical protein
LPSTRKESLAGIDAMMTPKDHLGKRSGKRSYHITPNKVSSENVNIEKIIKTRREDEVSQRILSSITPLSSRYNKIPIYEKNNV